MLDILQFYVSGFWVWAGITIGLGLAVQFGLALFAIFIGAITSTSVRINGEARLK